jgi:hypothetical protein
MAGYTEFKAWVAVIIGVYLISGGLGMIIYGSLVIAGTQLMAKEMFDPNNPNPPYPPPPVNPFPPTPPVNPFPPTPPVNPFPPTPNPQFPGGAKQTVSTSGLAIGIPVLVLGFPIIYLGYRLLRWGWSNI